MKKGEKKGQFFLVAAVIFLSIFFGLITILNNSSRQTNTQIENMAQEMRIESSKVLEYSAYTGSDKIENFTKKYSDYAGGDTRIYFITGNSTSQKVYNYTEGIKGELVPTFEGGILGVNIEGMNYNFLFREGNNFYFVLIQEINGEKYILRG